MDLVLPIVLVILIVAAAAYWYFSRKKTAVGDKSFFERIDPKKGDLPDGRPRSEEDRVEEEKTSAGKDKGSPENSAKAEGKPAAPVEPARREEEDPERSLEQEPPASQESFSDRPDIDQMTEVVVRLASKNPFSTKQALLASQPIRSQDFGTPCRIQVKNQFTKLWGPIQRGCTYTDMIVTLQLATRERALDELSAGNFVAAVNAAVTTLDADADVVDVPSVVAQAKSVKALIDRYGIRLSVGVKGASRVTEQTALQLAGQCGFEVNGSRIEKRDADCSAPWLRMLPNPADPNMVVLELMPALCAPAQNPLGALFGSANDIAARLNGDITDSSGVPLGPGEVVEITRQMKCFYAAMARQELDAGTRRVKRLFA